MTALALALVLAAPRTTAVLPAEGGPVRVDAVQLRYVYPKRQVIFTGDPLVRLTRGDAVLTCRRLVADSNEAGRVERATCSGDVKLVRGTRTVTCETATFRSAQSQVVCEGHPVLQDGGTVARGDTLVYDLTSDEVTLTPATITMPGDEVDARQKQLGARRKAGGGK